MRFEELQMKPPMKTGQVEMGAKKSEESYLPLSPSSSVSAGFCCLYGPYGADGQYGPYDSNPCCASNGSNFACGERMAPMTPTSLITHLAPVDLMVPKAPHRH